MSNTLLVLLAFIALSFAKANAAVLPLETLRSQGNSDHCWAYSTSHVIASHVQYKQDLAVSLDMERDLMYWVYYNRFMERFRKGAPLDEFKDEELTGEDGFPAEFWTKFIHHGQPIYSVTSLNVSSTVSYPQKPTAHLPFMSVKKPKGNALNALDLVAKLSKAVDEAQASKIILATLDASVYAISNSTTKWFGKPITLEDTPKYVLSSEYASLAQDEFLWVFGTQDAKVLHTWESYFNGKYRNYYMTQDELFELIKKSIDTGYGFVVTTREGGYEDHVMTGIGYDGDNLLIADSETPHYYWTKFSNVESATVFKSTVGAMIPRYSDMSVSPTKNPRIRPLR